MSQISFVQWSPGPRLYCDFSCLKSCLLRVDRKADVSGSGATINVEFEVEMAVAGGGERYGLTSSSSIVAIGVSVVFDALVELVFDVSAELVFDVSAELAFDASVELAFDVMAKLVLGALSGSGPKKKASSVRLPVQMRKKAYCMLAAGRRHAQRED